MTMGRGIRIATTFVAAGIALAVSAGAPTEAVPAPVSAVSAGGAGDLPDRIRHFSEIQSCHSVAGDFNYITKVRVATPLDLEDLLTRLRGAAHVQTRTTVVLSTAWEGRPVTGRDAPPKA